MAQMWRATINVKSAGRLAARMRIAAADLCRRAPRNYGEGPFALACRRSRISADWNAVASNIAE